MMFRIKCVLPFLFLCIGLETFAQSGNDYFIGVQLLRQQKYEEAARVLVPLAKSQPTNFSFLQQAVESLNKQKKYNEALSLLTESKKFSPNHIRLSILKAETHHLAEDTSAAYKEWLSPIENRPESQQVYYLVARSLTERSEYKKAIEVYKRAQDTFQDPSLYVNDLAYVSYMAGDFRAAVDQYLFLLELKPDQTDLIEQQINRFDDPFLVDEAILSLEERLNTFSLNSASPAKKSFQQLYVWLLMKRGLHRRALQKSMQFENPAQGDWYVFQVGEQLTELKKYTLAAEAWQYYLSTPNHPLRDRALYQSAMMNREQYRTLVFEDLDLSSTPDSLLQQAIAEFDELLLKFPSFASRANVILERAEIALESERDPTSISGLLSYLEEENEQLPSPIQTYLEGRQFLLQGDFQRARVQFTRSRTQSETGPVAERARYFSALTDFYSQDFEYSSIQLNALSRANSSLYANDALELRTYIRKGMSKDSASSELRQFSRALFTYSSGKTSPAIFIADSLVGSSGHPLSQELLTPLSRWIIDVDPVVAYYYLAEKELLLNESQFWLFIQLQYNFYQQNESIKPRARPEFLPLLGTEFEAQSSPSFTTDSISKAIDTFLIRFPDGYFSPRARQLLRTLITTSQS